MRRFSFSMPLYVESSVRLGFSRDAIGSLVLAVLMACAGSAVAQEKVLYNFGASSTDGIEPGYSNLISDGKGNLYGTTVEGGSTEASNYPGYRTVFELSPGSGGTWTEKILYNFQGPNAGDGAAPEAGLIFDAKGNLYGTTAIGGPNYTIQNVTAGTVFELSPGSGGAWTEKVLYAFGDSASKDGENPAASLVFDAAGNLYGTTMYGGAYMPAGDGSGSAGGTVFELSPGSGGTWTEKVLHSFGATTADGANPSAPVIFDSKGNLYGTTGYGGPYEAQYNDGGGTVFELSPGNGGSWSETVLYSFGQFDSSNDTIPNGANPYGGLVIDSEGNLYGDTYGGGFNSAPNPEFVAAQGVVFELSPGSSNSWTFKLLHTFVDDTDMDGGDPYAGVIFDAKGNLYGTTSSGGVAGSPGTGISGTVFELSPASGGNWTEAILFSFSSSAPTGYEPYYGTLLLDAEGNLYGTTYQGSANGLNDGVVFEIESGLSAKDNTATTLTASPTTASVGQTVTLTATVTRTSGTGTPTGTVTFTADGKTLGSPVTLNSSGVATLTASSASYPPGSYSLVATYNPDSADNGSSAAYTFVLTKVTTSTALTLSTESPTVGETVTLSATVARTVGSGYATGLVTFYDGDSNELGTATLKDGVASVTAHANYPVGTYNLKASYGGDASDYGSTSAENVVQLSAALTTTVLTITPDTVTPPGDVTLAVTVKRPSGSTGTPTGKVKFYFGGTSGVYLFSLPLTNGAASYQMSSQGVSAGQYSLTAAYEGDGSDATSVSAPVSVTVK
jgi:hypothetical protein